MYRNGKLMSSPPLVLLKSGTIEPPIFITHGLGGMVTELNKLVSELRNDRTVYGIQWKGLNDHESPQTNVEDMAEFFIDVLRQAQPEGPYILAGLSAGGLIMFEVA